MFMNISMQEYVEQAASGSETPGGGSISALAGALGSCMASMVGQFTVGKEKFADVEEEVQAILQKMEEYRAELLRCTEEDAIAFEAVGKVYGMPKSTDEEKAARTAAMQDALKNAMAVPLRVMRTGVEALSHLPRLIEIGNPNLITDTGVAAIMLNAAVHGGRLNVAINLKYIKDEALVAETMGVIRDLLKKADDFSRQTRLEIEKAL